MNHVSLVIKIIITTFQTNDLDSRKSRREYARGISPPEYCNPDNESYTASRYPHLLNFLNVKLGNWIQPVPLHPGPIGPLHRWSQRPVSLIGHDEVSVLAAWAWITGQFYCFCHKAASRPCTYNNQLQSSSSCPT